jgi:protein gp37
VADQRAGGISWTDATWNPIRGCSRVSEGCRNCYAERTAIRYATPHKFAGGDQSIAVNRAGPYYGLVKSTSSGPRWTGEVRFVEEALDLPVRWKKPRRIFVNSMSDLFHEKVEAGWIVSIFDVMRRCPQHTFQILTKRAELMRDWMAVSIYGRDPLPNVWLGVSVENQETADERIPLLLQTPAAVRWVSYEPALGPADFTRWLKVKRSDAPLAFRQIAVNNVFAAESSIGLDWIVVGGESGGPGARPFDLAWARSTIAQCRAAGVPVFCKQLGSFPVWDGCGLVANNPPGPTVHDAAFGREMTWLLLRDRKGGDPQEWPSDLRVREFPW